MYKALLFSCLIIAGKTTSASDKIHWFTDDRQDRKILLQPSSEPISTPTDTVRLLMEALPNHHFDIQFAQNPSISRLLKKLPTSCAPNRLKTPKRLKDNLYSLPLNIYLGLHLYYNITADFKGPPKHVIDENNHLISLDSLFVGKKSYTLGIDEGRSFGEFLDEQIANLDYHNLVIRAGGKRSTSLVHMLIKGRVDYIIDYPTEINKVIKNYPNTVKLGSLEVYGNPDFVVGYVACNKSKFGEEVIKNINKALKKLYLTPEFYHAHTRYLDEADIDSFNKIYQQVYNVSTTTFNP